MTDETENAVLKVRGLKVAFRDDSQWRDILKGVSFDVRRNETVAIVGESGSGKSVTALSIMQLLPTRTTKVEGRIELSGQDLLSLSETDMRKVRGNKISMIFQEPMTSLNPVMTIGNQIAEILRLHRQISAADARKETIALLEKVRIPSAHSRYSEYPHQFSGGMRQRVMIAMALACRPDVLIADEPTTALDVTVQAEVLELVKTLQREENMGVIFITHDMGVVAEIADRTIVMRNGEIVETAETAELFKKPRELYTQKLLATVPRLGSMSNFDEPRRFDIPGETVAPLDLPRAAPANAQTPVLQVRNLITRFSIRHGLLSRVSGHIHAAQNVSFDIGPGETFALVGESGCGKSTTGRSIVRLTEPLSGSVKVLGQEVLGASRDKLRDVRRNIQMIFQDPFASLNPRIRVGDAIAEPLRAYGGESEATIGERVQDLMARVGLSSDMARRFPHEFSGGQRQRICIARSLALKPSILIADESVSALDVSIKAQIVNLMLDLQQSLGMAYLFISHDMAIVERISHRVAVMYLGEIVEVGPRKEIFGNPQHPYTRRLIDAVPIPDPTLRKERRIAAQEELRSPLRALDYVPPERRYREVSTGHFVQH